MPHLTNEQKWDKAQEIIDKYRERGASVGEVTVSREVVQYTKHGRPMNVPGGWVEIKIEVHDPVGPIDEELAEQDEHSK